MVKNIFIDGLDLDGGALCLDFANTVSDRRHLPGKQYLACFNDLLYWAATKAEIITEPMARRLEKRAAEEPEKAEQFFKDAIEFRELTYSVFFELSKGLNVVPEQLEALNAVFKKYMPHQKLQQHGGHFDEGWDWEGDSFYQITAPVVKSARDLLLNGRFDRIKECGGNDCGWLFFDTSKNGSRRWCSMKTCGSNDKAIKYYYRKKGAKQ